MFIIEPISQQIQVVLLGNFNPAIIQPGWLAKHGVIGETEALNAKVDIIHPEVTVLHLAHVDLMLENDKCVVTSKGIHFDVVRDFLLKTFGEFLFHTPITALGINFIVHFDCGSFEKREEFARKIAPYEGWGDWGKSIEGTPEEEPGHGGLTSISMRQNTRPDDREGFIIVRVEPSARLQTSGLFMFINDHYQFSAATGGDSAAGATEVLEIAWEASLDYSEKIVNSVMTNFKK